MKVKSHEYKVMIDSAWLSVLGAAPAGALQDILDDVSNLADALKPGFALKVLGEFDMTRSKQRTVRFLDTPDFTLRQNGLLLR